MAQEINLRYNTEKDKTNAELPAWRVLINGVEHLAETVEIRTSSRTTKNLINGDLVKWHVSCLGRVEWTGKHCLIRPVTQPGVIWLTGLSGAGKTTIAQRIAAQLRSLGHQVEEMDGDVIRSFFPTLGFTDEERDAHVRRVGYMCSRIEAQGTTVIASLISPSIESRKFVRQICKNYFEVYVSTPLSVCEARDPKGLYKKARRGEIQNFTGISSEYQVPINPEFTIDTTAADSTLIAEEIIRQYLIFSN